MNNTIYYLAVVQKKADEDYKLSFPDFPDCMVSSESPHDLEGLATRALQYNVDNLLKDGYELPEVTHGGDIISSKGGCPFYLLAIPAVVLDKN